MTTYKIENLIGDGTYGEVFKTQHNEVHKLIPFEIFDLEKSNPHFEKFCDSYFTEFTILSQLTHPNIIKYVKHFFDDEHGILVMEFGGENILKLKMSPKLLKKMMKQILSGLNYLHQNYMHRDLKPENIVYDKENGFKIIDFGQCIDKKAENLIIETSHWYASPEVLLGDDKYSTPLDIWSLGCIFYEKYLSNNISDVLFRGSSITDILLRIFHTLGTPTCEYLKQLPDFKSYFPNYTPHLKRLSKCEGTDLNFLLCMLEYTPSKRITAEEALNHRYFQE